MQPALPEGTSRRAVWVEICLVVLLTFGLSGLSSLLYLVQQEVSGAGIGSQTVALNPATTADVFDALTSLLRVLRLLTYAGLALYLLHLAGLTPRRVLRFTARVDVPAGLGLAALIGLPGLGLYYLGRVLELGAQVLPASPLDTWWRPLTLLGAAAGNAAAEELLVVAYLMTRLRQLGVGLPAAIGASALLRGSYHLYQGFGAGIGNIVMGIVFGWAYARWGRVLPLIIAHFAIDAVAFAGYALLADRLGPLLR